MTGRWEHLTGVAGARGAVSRRGANALHGVREEIAIAFGPRTAIPSAAVGGPVAEQGAIERAPENRIAGFHTLRSPHRLVREAIKAFAAFSQPTSYHTYAGPARHLDIQVSKDQFKRALRILDALLKPFDVHRFARPQA